MKPRIFISSLALSSLLPFATFGQSAGNSTGSDQPTSRANQTTRQNSQTTRQNTDANRSNTGAPATQADARRVPVSSEPWGTSAASTTVTGIGGIHRLNPEQLEQRVTASSLIGKEIVDRDGKTIGTIKDLGLTGVLPLHLQSKTDRRTDARTVEAGVRPPTQGQPETTPVESNPMAGANPMQPGGTADVNVLVQVSGELGLEEDLLVIPASQLWRVEGDQERYRIVMSDAELKNLASPHGMTAPAE